MATTPINQSDSHPSNPTTPSAENYGVIFVLGGPGAGKGTQCAMLAQEFQLQHLSVGDVLRAERDTPGSQYGELVAHNMYEGKVGPMEVTVKLLHKAMEDAVQRDGIEVFLIDGFPRKIDQLDLFESTVSRARVTLFLNSCETTRFLRLAERGRIENRSDDTDAIIRKRFDTFNSACMPVVKSLASEGRVRFVNADRDKSDIYTDIKGILSEVLGLQLKKR